MAVVASDSVVVIATVHSYLDGNVSSGRDLDHLSIKHYSEDFRLFVHLVLSDLGFEFIARVAPNDIFVPTEKVCLARSQAICTETCYHNGSIWPVSNCIPRSL
jgi:hypothetical protein